MKNLILKKKTKIINMDTDIYNLQMACNKLTK